ncbi:MAG: hypothetical protein JWQ97_281, partial [Phenylobacterium sp.]|nr:hypothetical protein [Phenylobacterium sp.]
MVATPRANLVETASAGPSTGRWAFLALLVVANTL